MDSNIAVALIGAGATVAAALITTVYARRRDHTPSSDGHTRPAAPFAPSRDLDGILACLERHRQRATFGAVAGLLGREPLTLFDGYPRTARTSWVVSKSTGEPTGQDASALHPDLFKNPHIITSSGELKIWLVSHQAASANRRHEAGAMEIAFVNRSRFLDDCEHAIRDGRDRLEDGEPVEVALDRGGYSGRAIVTVRAGDSTHFGALWEGSDPTRFPARIRAAATALLNCGCHGRYEIDHRDGALAIRRA
jgi:hypothetical protein